MRKFICWIFVFALFVGATSTPAYAEKRCYGTEGVQQTIKNEGRFNHCNKGDVISVYTATLKEGLSKVTELRDVFSFAIREDEIALYCSFEHPIVSFGETKVVVSTLAEPSALIVNWHSCIYRGSEREAITSPVGTFE